MTPLRATRTYPHWDLVSELIHDAFAYMEPLLGHPARAASVTPEHLADASELGAAFIIEDAGRPVACLFTRPSRDIPDALYLGWLAVEAKQRGKGLAAILIRQAETEARNLGNPLMTLDTGHVLTDLHRLFERLGFQALPGDAAIITFTKPVD